MLNFGRVLRKYSEYAKIAENLKKCQNPPKPDETCTNRPSKRVQNRQKMTSGRVQFRKGRNGSKSDEGRYSPFYFRRQNYFIGFNIGCLFWTLFQTPRFGPPGRHLLDALLLGPLFLWHLSISVKPSQNDISLVFCSFALIRFSLFPRNLFF